MSTSTRTEPYRDADLTPEERVDDLLPRLSLEEKAGLMFHTVIEAGADGSVLEGPGRISKTSTREVVQGKLVNHFNVHDLDDPRSAARWYNAVQRLAAETPHGIPVTISTDPRHAFIQNAGTSFAAKAFSQWPEPLGLAALRDPALVRRFADVARQEYVAVGIRAALHPTLDLATEPRWARQAHTFGQDPQVVTELSLAYLAGFQQDRVGPGSVACTAKHFPGGGPQKDGEDAHFPYGREQVYGGGRFDDHLSPFPPVLEAGVAAVMPYYGMPVDLVVDGEEIEQVGFGYNRQVVTGMLRERLGYQGVVLTDWELVNDNHVGDQVLPARSWGVEHLDPHGRMELILHAGCDQFGGEECVDVLLDLVRDGRVTEERVDESARRLLLVKFRLGLFDDPYVDEEAAAATVGREDFRAEGLQAQAASVTVLQDGSGRTWRPAPRTRAARVRRGCRSRGRRPVRHGRRPAGGRRRRPGAADGAVRAAFGPVPGVLVPPGLARLPAGSGRPARPGRGGLPARARRRPRPPGGAHAPAAAGHDGRGQLRHLRRRAAAGPDRCGAAARSPAVRPAALDGAGAPAPRGRAGVRRPAVHLRVRARRGRGLSRPDRGPQDGSDPPAATTAAATSRSLVLVSRL